MRKFNHYKKELTLEALKKGGTVKTKDQGDDAKKVQEWLCLNAEIYPSLKSLVVDSNFGKITETCVKEFQKLKNINPSGIVDESTFFELTKPLRNAFTPKTIPHNDFRELICKIAQLHCDNRPRELSKGKIGNLGPWVRSYFGGNDGDDYWWCMRFIVCVLDIACDLASKNLTSFTPLNPGGDCDLTARFALAHNRLIRNVDLKQRIGEIRPGDLFFKYSPDGGNEWHHVGFITKVEADGTIETIEGNASSDKLSQIGDTSNGTGVYSKYRNLFNKKQITRKDGTKYWDYYEVYHLDV